MSTEPRDNSDLPEHEIAMVVFTSVRAVDALDGAAIVRKAIVDSFTDTHVIRPYKPVTILARPQAAEVSVVISEVVELGAAGGNGYLWTKPTGKGYPRTELSDVD